MKFAVIKKLIVLMALVVQVGCYPANFQVTITPTTIPFTNTPETQEKTGSAAGTAVLFRVLTGHRGRILDVEFSSRGELLASSSQDMEIKIWDLKSGEQVHAFSMRSVDMADIDISTIRNYLASGEAIWDLESKQEIHILERGSHAPGFAAFSPDGAILALGLFDQPITLWDVESGQPISAFDRQDENRTKRMAFSPDGSLLAVGVADGSVRLLDAASGIIVKTLQYVGETDTHDLAFSPDGRYLATGGRMPLVILWEVDSGEVARIFRLTDHAISLDFSPDGRVLATAGGSQYEVRLWNVDSGELLNSIAHNDQLSSIAFSPDGKLLAVGSFDGNIYLWGISTTLQAE